jgi:hypothetical protein
MSFFARISNLHKLAARYPAAEPPQGTPLHKQTVQVGPVRFRRCVTLQIGDAGLYLQVRAPLSRHPPVQIPWTEITPVGTTRIYWRPAMLLSVGSPEIATLRVQMDLFERLRPYLNGSRLRSALPNEGIEEGT